jgi:hypothetical protein
MYNITALDHPFLKPSKRKRQMMMKHECVKKKKKNMNIGTWDVSSLQNM